MGEIYYKTSTLESIARKVLLQYDPFYLNQPAQAVPLEKIIEDIFELSIEYMHLTATGDELGRMIYDDGFSTRWNPEKDSYELIRVAAGTILIEAALLDSPMLYGRFRFTLAHELAHWILHKQLFTGTGVAAATYELDGYSDNSVEWQANYLGKAILMPNGQVKRGFYQARSENRTTAGIVSSLAETFAVSRQAMEIRLKELGLING